MERREVDEDEVIDEYDAEMWLNYDGYEHDY